MTMAINRPRARQLAQQIASSPALAVLGQVASSAAAAAGDVYKEQGIPAITGAASEARLFCDCTGDLREFSSVNLSRIHSYDDKIVSRLSLRHEGRF